MHNLRKTDMKVNIAKDLGVDNHVEKKWNLEP